MRSPDTITDPLAATGLLRAALDSMPDLSVVVFDRELRIAAIYGGAVRAHGHAPELLIGRLAPEVVPTPIWERYGELYERTLGGESTTVDVTSVDGTATYESTFEPIVLDDAVVGGLVSLRNVTTQRRADAERREHARTVQQFASILAHSPFAVDLRDPDGRWLVANDRYHAVVGAEPGELIGKHLADIFPAATADALREIDAKVVAIDGPRELHRTVPDAEHAGELRHRWTLRFPVRDADGDLIGVGGFSADVTDREVQRRELVAVTELFETAFRNAPVGKVITRIREDGSGELIKCNPAFAQMLGLSADQVLGRSGPSLIYPADRAKHRDLLLDAEHDGQATTELRFLHADGEGVWTQCAVSRARSAAGEELRVVQAVDITARKRAEDELRYIADHDALTGIRGRRSFEQELGRASRGVRTGAIPCAALLLIDLNGFKAVNDTLGHSAGDDILTRVAAALQDAVRPDDLVARLGGDEFAVLLPETDRTGAERVTEKLEATVARCGITHHDGQTASVTAAIGITMLTPDAAYSPAEALRHADAAMYRAKAEGRDLTDPDRIAAVHATGLVGAPAEPELQRIVDALAGTLTVPIALVSFLTADTQHFIAHHGLGDELAGLGCQHSDDSYCQYPAASGRPLIVPDTRIDPLLADHVATVEMGLRSYAGLPLTVDGQTVGVLCVAATEPRAWTTDEQATLRFAAAHVTRFLEQTA